MGTNSMNDHNLDDLIVRQEHIQKGNKAGGILTIIALLVIVLIIVIVLTKVVLKEPKVDAVVTDNSTQMIDSKLKLQLTPKAKEDRNDSIEQKSDTINIDTITIDEDKQESLQKPIIATKVKSTPKTVSKPKPVQKVLITDEFEQIKSTPKPKPIVNTSYKYYIQVGSFSQEPNGIFLDIVKKSGFHYIVINANGRKKLLIGPYSSRSAVDSALAKVRDRINKGAFVYKVK